MHHAQPLLRSLWAGLLLALIPLNAGAAGPLLISEVMASNTRSVADEDGDFPDWIEIYNASSDPIDLFDWRLSDDPNEPGKWRFPSTNLGPGQVLLVFASDKNRRTPGAPLHTNFRLAATGEYLGLVAPGGGAISHSFSPQFPGMNDDVSYGIGAVGSQATLVATGALARASVPADGSLGLAWTQADFDDSGWVQGRTGVGYERRPGDGSWIGLDLLSLALPPAQRIDRDGDGVNENTSVYVRLPFLLAPQDTINALTLRLRYEDGFVAYLNGHEISRANEPPILAWNSAATTDYGAVQDVMVAIVYGPGNAITIYRNGEEYASAANTTIGTLRTYPANIADVLIGKRHDDQPNTGGTRLGVDAFLAGSVNEARVYRAPLTAAEVRALFEFGPVTGTAELPASARTNLLHQWTFNDGTARDSIGSAHGTLLGSPVLEDGRLVLDGIDDFMRSAPVQNDISVRTLAVWVSLDNLVQQAGGALTLENPIGTDVFDGIVFGERVSQQWMNGSSLFARSVRDNGGAPETTMEIVVTGPEAFDVSAQAGRLRTGTNVLAIHGLIHAPTDPNLLIFPELIGGRFALDPERSGYFDAPTPGQINGTQFQRVFANLSFSHERGIYQSPFTLTVTSDVPDVTLRYTLNGRAPNLTNSIVYTQPIEVQRTMTLRLAAFRPDQTPSEPISRTFLFLSDVLRQSNSAPAGAHWDTQMDPQVVNNPFQTWTVANGLVDLPVVSVLMDNADLFGPNGIYANASNRGDDWERAASVELWYPQEYSGPRQSTGFGVNCGIQINGNFSRLTHQPKHSFRLVFKRKWGPSKLEYPLFPESEVAAFDTLLLACGHNQGWSTGIENSQYLRNRFTWGLEGADPSPAHVHSLSVHVYLNGLYWGLYDFHERPDETFGAANFGGSKEEYDVFKGLSTGGSTSAPIINGTREAWDRLFILADRDLSNAANFSELSQLVDIDQLIDYSIGILYTADRDGPTGWLNGPPNSLEPKNFYASRRRVPEGRFRFWRWDSEFVLENVGEDVSERQGTQNPARLHYNLRANPEYRRRFGDRVQELFFRDGPFTAPALASRYLKLAAEIDKAVVAESARWGDSKREPPFSRDVEWVRERDRIVNSYLPGRLNVFLNQLRADRLFPTFSAPGLSINGVPQFGGQIQPGNVLTLTATNGRIYYTLDGTDPRGLSGPVVTPLISETGPVRALVPTSPALGTTWRASTFGDASWLNGANGVGYERGSEYRPSLGLDLLAAAVPPAQRIDTNGDGTNENNTVYARFSFQVSDPLAFNGLSLRMRYDDGFVAFLNGFEVARANAPATLDWNSAATTFRGEGAEVMIAIAYAADNTITIYRNGQLYAPTATTSQGTLQTYPAGVADVLIGKRHQDLAGGGTVGGADGFLAGAVNEARVYSRALSSAEILTLFSAGPMAGANPAPPQVPSNLAHQWTFNDGTGKDAVGSAHGVFSGGATVTNGRLLLDGVDNYMQSAPIGAALGVRTLVVWVSLDNLTQQAGSALTLENPTGADNFDGIVFGERVARQWMNGSGGFARTVVNNGGASETAAGNGALAYHSFDLTPHVSRLTPGANVLAIHGLNSANYRANMLIMPVLEGLSAGLAPNALLYTGPLSLADGVVVRARVLVGTEWSTLTEGTFFTPPDYRYLHLTEIMYHPPGSGVVPGDELEFLELHNTGPNALPLDGMFFSAGIDFQFPRGSLLAPSEHWVLVRNQPQFAQRYPNVPEDRIRGSYLGQLDNAGETLRLTHPVQGDVLEITYNNRAPWAVTPDGHGFSLVPRDPEADLDPDRGSLWRASAAPGGSPGTDDPEPGIPRVLINEVLTASISPAPDAIELFYPGPGLGPIGGWFLTDDAGQPRKFRLPDGLSFAAGMFLKIDEPQFNPLPITTNNFALSSRGEEVYLFSADAQGNLTGYDHGFRFGAALDGVTFGRHTISTGDDQFPPQLTSSLNAPNAGPRIGPVVITEIHYRGNAAIPPLAGTEGSERAGEFIELRNISAQSVALVGGTVPWRVNGIDFDFPPGAVLAPNEVVLVTAADPTEFRTRFGVPSHVAIFGPYAGNLQNGSEQLELQRPRLDPEGVVYVTVDEVSYRDRAPWPAAADGTGASLQRQIPSLYGNDPAHWIAALPTPGAAFPGGAAPVITTQPTALTVVGYLNATFQVTASGPGPLFYQWRFQNRPLPGATDSMLVIPDVQAANAGAYSVVVYNAGGAAVSSNALLTVRLPAQIVQHPQNRTATNGGAAAFSVVATGQGVLRYQWRLFGTNLPGATNATLSLASVQPSQAGPYLVVVTDAVGSAPSLPATLTVLIRPTLLTQPQSQTVVRGDTVTFRVTSAGSFPMTYRWRLNGIGRATNVLDSHSSAYTIPNVQAAHAGAYTVAISNPAGAAPVSSAATLVVLADFDGDHIADVWEAQYGFNTNNAADGLFDADGDTSNNYAEFIAGTDPTNALSYLRIEQLVPGTPTRLTFLAVSNRTYSVQFAPEPHGPTWSKLIDVSASPTTRFESVLDPAPGSRRFYRLTTP